MNERKAIHTSKTRFCRLPMHVRYPAESKEIDNIVGVLFTVVSWLAAP